MACYQCPEGESMETIRARRRAQVEAWAAEQNAIADAHLHTIVGVPQYQTEFVPEVEEFEVFEGETEGSFEPLPQIEEESAAILVSNPVTIEEVEEVSNPDPAPVKKVPAKKAAPTK